MVADFGGGIYLTNQSDLQPEWDLKVDTTGDIKTIIGEEELQKDVSYANAVRLQDIIGSPITPLFLNRIEARVRDAFDDETRIESILLLDVNEIDRNTVEIDAEVVANDTTVELIFEVTS